MDTASELHFQVQGDALGAPWGAKWHPRGHTRRAKVTDDFDVRSHCVFIHISALKVWRVLDVGLASRYQPFTETDI